MLKVLKSSIFNIFKKHDFILVLKGKEVNIPLSGIGTQSGNTKRTRRTCNYLPKESFLFSMTIIF